MIKSILRLLCVSMAMLSACAYSPDGEPSPNQNYGEASDKSFNTPIIDAGYDAADSASDACVRQKIYVFQPNMHYDLNCPLQIIWDPKQIPPWDPEPIIK